MKWDVLNKEGQKVSTIELDESVFAVDLNDGLLHTVVKAYLANKRQGTHATKTRSLVSGGGRKPFKQKGTGGARQGSTRSPLMPGGAVVHGPQPRDYRQKINKRVKQQALKMALSDRVKANKLIVVDDFAVNTFNTKAVLKILKAFEVENNLTKVLFCDAANKEFYTSTRNIAGKNYLEPQQINAEDVLRHEYFLVSKNAVQAMQQRLVKREEA